MIDSVIMLGFLIILVSWIWIIILAFKESTGWGVACMFFPIISLIYVIKYRRFLPLIVLAIGIAMYLASVIIAAAFGL